MTEFNLAAAMAGAPVVNRAGTSVRVLCMDNINNKVLVEVRPKWTPFYTIKVNIDGSRYSASTEHFEDLFMAA